MKRIFLLLTLIPQLIWGEQFELSSHQEDLVGLDLTSSEAPEIPLFIGKVGENNIPEGFETNDERLDLTDLVKTTQSSTKKEQKDDLVFYDYGEQKSDITKMAQKAAISPRVQGAIAREVSPQALPGVDRNQELPNYFTQDPPEITEDVEKSNSKITITGYEASIGKGEGQKIYDFEFVPDYDNFNSVSDFGTGILEVRENLSSSMGIIRGSIFKRDFVRMKVDVVFQKKEKFIEVPFINQDEFDLFLEKNQLSGVGGAVLVDLHESVKSVEIDANYEAKIYLSNHFVKVEEGKERFVLFLGIAPGNILLRVMDASNEIGQKIINVTEGEIYFDQVGIIPGKIESVELFEKNILGKVNTELNIDGKFLKTLNSDYAAKNAGINRYEYFRPALPTGSRKYFELSHQAENLFMGIWNSKKVELPDTDFRNQILYQLNLKGLTESCLIQANFTKPVLDFKAVAEGIDLEIYFLGNDGLISSEIVENSSKAFILGNLPGVISGLIKYLDGTKDFFTSPCSHNAYLVEQF